MSFKFTSALALSLTWDYAAAAAVLSRQAAVGAAMAAVVHELSRCQGEQDRIANRITRAAVAAIAAAAWLIVISPVCAAVSAAVEAREKCIHLYDAVL